jgi:hypothetical protein
MKAATMTNSGVRIDADGRLLCPECGSEYSHAEIVYVATRKEDGPFDEITVNAITGQVRTQNDPAAPTGEIVGAGRRHRIAVSGSCETGAHSFAVVLTQHKGVTLAETVTGIPHETDGDPQTAARY